MPTAESHPRTPPAQARLLPWWLGLYALAMVGVAVLVQRLSDAWWPATLVLFGPRWLWALPLLALVPAALLWRRQLLWPLAGTALLWLFAVAGFVMPSARSMAAHGTPPELRVVTYNMGEGRFAPGEIVAWLDDLAPKIAAFQECAALIEPVRKLLVERGWHVEVQQGSCLVSRYPVRRVEARDPTAIWKMYGSGIVVRYEIETPGRVVNVVNVHLATVRRGLDAIRYQHWSGVAELESNIEQRDLESLLAHAFALQSHGPLLVTGDFNMPMESAIYRKHWSDLNNAFTCAGHGLGHTKETRWHGIRIDHVLLGPGWSCLGTHVADDLGGDHRPMVADLAWRGEP
jgi:vancomycin resistance protein VanJ